MGQTPSSPPPPPLPSPPRAAEDLTVLLPDDCLALVFHRLSHRDRLSCSLVSRRWLAVEGLSRTRLSLDASPPLLDLTPSLLSRFPSLSSLSLRSHRRSDSIGDDALLLFALRSPLLSRLSLRSLRSLTPTGMSLLASHSQNLRSLSCSSCSFGSLGVAAVLRGCPGLRHLSLRRLRGAVDVAVDAILVHDCMRSFVLKEVQFGECLVPMIAACRNLRTLRVERCPGDWDGVLVEVAVKLRRLGELHLEKVLVSDRGLKAVTHCKELQNLHLVKTPDCTDEGLSSIAKSCSLLQKLHVDGWRTDRIGDAGIAAVARGCQGLQELVLIGLNPTLASLSLIAENCHGLERLAVCSSETFGDAEVACIAGRCSALQKLCIKQCPISDAGMEALAGGCPRLVKVKVKKCRNVTEDGAELLRASRGVQVVGLDTDLPELDEVSDSENGAPEEGMEQVSGTERGVSDAHEGSGTRFWGNGRVGGLCLFVTSAFRSLSVASSSQ